MARYVLLGNSGSVKSTLAARLARGADLAHLDLDSLAWEPVKPPRRRPVAESAREITSFMDANDRWVIEGSYADLLEASLPRCTRLLFLNPGIEVCVANARVRLCARMPLAERARPMNDGGPPSCQKRVGD